jgi:hypothetical protein
LKDFWAGDRPDQMYIWRRYFLLLHRVQDRGFLILGGLALCTQLVNKSSVVLASGGLKKTELQQEPDSEKEKIRGCSFSSSLSCGCSKEAGVASTWQLNLLAVLTLYSETQGLL